MPRKPGKAKRAPITEKRARPPRATPQRVRIPDGTINRDWLNEQIERSDWTAQALSAAIWDSESRRADGINPNRIKQFRSESVDGKEAGPKKLKNVRFAEAVAIAQLLNLSVWQLLRGLGFDWPRRTVPLLGSVNSSARVQEYPAPQSVEACGEADHNTRALVIDWPGYMLDGGHVYYQVHDGIHPVAFRGAQCVLLFGSGDPEHARPEQMKPPAIVGSLVGTHAGHYHDVRLFGGPIERFRWLEQASPITWIRHPVIVINHL